MSIIQRDPRTAGPAAPVKRWQVVKVLKAARKEARKILNRGQYVHMTDLVKQLVGFGRGDYESALRISQLDEFWELKEKGGILGRKNVRVYFAYRSESNEVVVLSTYKKEDDGAAPQHIFERLRNRFQQYRLGYLQDGLITHRHPQDDAS